MKVGIIKYKPLNVVSFIYLLWFALGAGNIAVAQQQNIAIFQFTATSMDVVGIENDVVYVVRNELRKLPNLSLLNQREMEATLMRNRIIQSFEVAQAVNAGVALDVNFVVIGAVSRQKGSIVSDIALVATDSQQQIANWTFSFINQQDVLNRGAEIGSAINSAIQSYLSESSQQKDSQQDADWLATISANLVNGQVKLNWELASFAPESLGFNIFRASSKQGPFSYITSVLETEYFEQIQDLSGDIYYQVSLLDAAGEEFRSQNIAKVSIAVAAVSDLAPPAVISVTQLMKGVEVVFIPSAQNANKTIGNYQLLRRQKGQGWVVVNTIQGPNSGPKSANNQSQNIQQYKIVDAQPDGILGPVEYAIRAANQQGLGNISSIYQHIPVTPPELFKTEPLGVRQVLIKWQAVSSGQGYHLYKREAGGNNDWSLLTTINQIEQNEYIDSEFSEDGQTFEYALSVFDQYSTSPKSQAVLLSSRAPLPPPTHVVVKSGMARKVQINWQPYQDQALKGYAIFRADHADNTDVRLYKIDEVLDPLANSYTDDSLDADNKDYYYAIAAINSSDSAGQLSPVFKASTKPSPKPVSAVNTQVTSQQILLSWTPNDSQAAANYVIERRWENGQWQSLATVSGQKSTYIDKQLLPQAQVEYRVTVVDSDNLRSESMLAPSVHSQNTVQFVPQPEGLLRQVNLAWAPIAVADSLQLYRQDDNHPWTLVAELDGREQSYVDKQGLLDDVNYQYKLKIIYQGQLVSESGIISMKTKGIPAPGSLVAESGDAQNIRLTWAPTHDTDLKSYIVYRASDADNYQAFKPIAEIPVTETSSYVDSIVAGGIAHGKAYRYAIASRNIFEEVGPIGQSIEAHTKALPTKVTDFSLTIEPDQVKLNWKTGPELDLKSALVYRRWQHEKQWSLIAEIDASITQYQDFDLLPFASFEYKVNLLDKDLLTSEDSNTLSETSPITVLLSATEQGLLRKNSISWNDNKQVESYLVQRSENKLTWQNIDSTGQSQYLDVKNLLDQKTYYYQVVAYHKQHKLGISNIIQVQTKDLPKPPENFLATSGQVQKVSLNWTPHSDPDVGGYIIYRLENDGELNELSTLNVQQMSYTDEGGFFSKLEHGSLYHYQISAFNRFKVEGQKSSPIAATTKALPSKVNQVSVNKDNGLALLTWQANPESDIKHYDIYRGKSCGRERKLATVNSLTLTYIDKDIEAEKNYCYYIIAVDTDLLESQPSDHVTIVAETK